MNHGKATCLDIAAAAGLGGKKGDPFRYQNAGIQVPNMYGVPENQNPKNNVSDEPQRVNAGTRPLISCRAR
jgi:hypothetical protein